MARCTAGHWEGSSMYRNDPGAVRCRGNARNSTSASNRFTNDSHRSGRPTPCNLTDSRVAREASTKPQEQASTTSTQQGRWLDPQQCKLRRLRCEGSIFEERTVSHYVGFVLLPTLVCTSGKSYESFEATTGKVLEMRFSISCDPCSSDLFFTSTNKTRNTKILTNVHYFLDQLTACLSCSSTSSRCSPSWGGRRQRSVPMLQ